MPETGARKTNDRTGQPRDLLVKLVQAGWNPVQMDRLIWVKHQKDVGRAAGPGPALSTRWRGTT